MLEKINTLIRKNNFADAIEFDGVLAARVILAAYGVQADARTVKHATLGLYQGGKLVAKVKMPDPAINRWDDGFGNFTYESPRVANVAGETVDFGRGLFRGNRHELGFADPTYTIGYDYTVGFDEIRILSGSEALEPFGKRAVVYVS